MYAALPFGVPPNRRSFASGSSLRTMAKARSIVFTSFSGSMRPTHEIVCDSGSVGRAAKFGASMPL